MRGGRGKGISDKRNNCAKGQRRTTCLPPGALGVDSGPRACMVRRKLSKNQQTLVFSPPLLNPSCIFSRQLVAQTKKMEGCLAKEEREGEGSKTKAFMTVVDEPIKGDKARVCRGSQQRSCRVKRAETRRFMSHRLGRKCLRSEFGQL